MVAVLLLVPAHFFAERPRPTVASALIAALLFFAPLAIAACRLEAGEGGLLGQAIRYLGFGLFLGTLVGVVGGLEKWLLHLVTGDPLPIRPAVWTAVALLFAVGTGLAYGVMLCLFRGFGALVVTPAEALHQGPGEQRSRRAGVLYSLVPGLGHFAVGNPGRGKPFLLAAVAAGLSGLVIAVVALILLVEAGIPTLPLLVAGVALVLFPLVLVLLSALDVLFLARR
jgi:hypothetical protein